MGNEAGREEETVTPNDEKGVIRLCEVNRDRQRETKEQDRKRTSPRREECQQQKRQTENNRTEGKSPTKHPFPPAPWGFGPFDGGGGKEEAVLCVTIHPTFCLRVCQSRKSTICVCVCVCMCVQA